MNELYREFFFFDNNFVQCVRSLEAAQRLPVRADASYRVSDAYLILDRVSRATTTQVDARFAMRPAFAPSLSLEGLDDSWWAAIDAVTAGSTAVERRRTDPVIRNRAARTIRIASDQEQEKRARRVLSAALREERELAASLPVDDEWWRVRLRVHAQLVVQLRKAGFGGLARLCAGQLSLACELGEIRLRRRRDELRQMVGFVPGDLTTAALTAASFSLATRAYDEAFEALVSTLPDYNAAAVPDLRLGPDDVRDLLDHLTQAGLADWMLQLSAEAWEPGLLSRMSTDQRIAMVFGRVRTLCAILEEGMLTFAAATNDSNFTKDVEAAKTMGRRLEVFVKGPATKASPVSWTAVSRLTGTWTTKQSLLPAYLKQCFNALMMPAGDPAPPPGPGSVHVIAGLFFVRNLTSHRFPVIVSNMRAPWFTTWGEHLPAANRTVEWSGLALWALVKHFR